MRIKNLLLILFLGVFCNCEKRPMISVDPQIIPEPSKMRLTEGRFILNAATQISFPEDFNVSADFLKTFISNACNFELKTTPGGNKISFIKDDVMIDPEAYKLIISEKEVKILAATDQGAFYAVQTFRQLLPESFENKTFKEREVAVQCLRIEDKPQFKYRGMHLDVGRHLFSVDFIKKYIDALAMLKMNTFHWHLTEDQGWRIEIKKYPKLNEIAAFRKETLIGHYSDQPQQFDGKRYGGYYTHEQIKDIVKYANNRKITIIPEIEMPGHSQAAIAAYPELGCTGDRVEVATLWGVFETVYCTKDETFTFLQDVLDEVMTLFPGKYIHIGGDEAPKTHWKSCANCQDRIKEQGLKDEHELQNYFITRIEEYLNSKGRQIIGWDEILEGGLAPHATVMSWRGTKGAIDAAKQKHPVVMTPTSHCYFDYYQSDNEDEPIAIGGFLPLEKVYSFNPIPEELTSEESQYIIGAQGNLWTEYMPTSKHVEYMAFPRMIAMSEVVWSEPEQKDYDGFISRLEQFYKRLDALNINYANHLYEVEGELVTKDSIINYTLHTFVKDKVIRYTVNGEAPHSSSDIYTKAIPITSSTTLKAAVFNSDIKLGRVFTQEINYHKAVGKTISINKKPHRAYSGSGAEGLINGISGSNKRFGDKEWLGFWGDDIEIVIDLGKEKKINSIKTRFHNGNGQWIYAPREVLLRIDDRPDEVLILNNNDNLIIDWHLDLNTHGKVVTLKIPNYGTIPEGKQGAGNKAWTFIDEIIIR